MSSEELNERMKQLEKGLKIDAMSNILMGAGDVQVIHRLNLIVCLLTMILDEVKE